jgi:hypothetical protein
MPNFWETQQPSAPANFWQSQQPAAAPQIGLGEAIARGGAEAGLGLEPKIEGIQAAGQEPGGTDLGNLARGLYRYWWEKDPKARAAYAKKAEEEAKRNALAAQQHPMAYAGSAVGASLLTPTPEIEGLRALGLGGRALENAIIGGGIGAASGIGSAQGTPMDYLKQAAIGGGFGFAGGLLGTPLLEGAQGAIGQLASKATYPFRTMTEEGAKGIAQPMVAGALQKDIAGGAGGLTPQEVQNLPHAVVGDIGAGPNTQNLVRAATNISPEAETTFRNVFEPRQNTRNARVMDLLNSFRTHPDDAAMQASLDRIEAAKRGTNNANYRQALTDGDKPILTGQMWQQVRDNPDMQQAIQKALPGVKTDAALGRVGARDPQMTFDQQGRPIFTNNTFPNLHFWDQVKRVIDDNANSALRAGRNNEAGRYGDLATLLRNELDTQVGSYAKARSGAAGFFNADNPVEAATNFFKGKMDATEARIAIAKFPPTERSLFQDQLLKLYHDSIASKGDASSSLLDKINGSPKARETLNVGLGTQRANQLESMVRSENVMSRLRNAVRDNSTSVKQYLAAMGVSSAIGGYTGEKEGGTPGELLGGGMGAVIGRMLAGAHSKMALEADKRVMNQVAKLITSKDIAGVMRGHQAIARSKNLMNAMRYLDTTLAKAAGTQAGTTQWSGQ